MLNGLVGLGSLGGGEADLSRKIAKVGIVDTPLYSAIPKYVPKKSADREFGHAWKYEEMPTGRKNSGFHAGSEPADPKSWGYEKSLNHYEIFKDTYGVEGSMEDAENIAGSDEFARQKAMAFMEHRMTIENSLFDDTQAPIAPDKENGIVGKTAGLYHWCGVHNTLDLTVDNVQLNDVYLRNFLKFGGLNGVPTTHMYVNDLVKDQVDDLFKDQIRRTPGATIMKYANYTEIHNLAYCPRLKIVWTHKMKQGDILGANMPSLALVYQRLSKKYPLGRVKDAVSEEVISELTCRVNNNHGVSLLKGLKI